MNTEFGEMRLFRYWKSKEFSILIDGVVQNIICKAGSNLSPDDAEALCKKKADHVQNIINGNETRIQEYEKPICEEIVQEVDSSNIVTRNRYGALILNTTSLNIFDIDQHKKSFLEYFGFKKDNKKTIVENLRNIFEKHAPTTSNWRIYETCKGIRLILVGEYFAPDSYEFRNFSKQINADPLYTWLCTQQHCCRARLTPKPYRMKIETIKYHCPIPEGQEEHYRQWIANYQHHSQNFAVCRPIETLGYRIIENAIVNFHDRICCNDQADILA